MKEITYYSTNNKNDTVSFETALLKGLAPDYGLYMIDRNDIPKLSKETIQKMKHHSYEEIAFQVLDLFLKNEIPSADLKKLLKEAYKNFPTEIQHVTGKTHIMWLSSGPTYSFKDYAARFLGQVMNYFLEKRNERRTIFVATSGDTGGAMADAFLGLPNVDVVIFYPKDSISANQRRQMTTLQKNVFAFEVNGDFDVCQALAKKLLGDTAFAKELGDENRFTSANSINLGRLLPQAVYPFYAYSRTAEKDESMAASVPSGNFGDMMGTIIAKEMGLPVSTIICGVNENTEFPDYLTSGKYEVRPSIKSPSSAMIVSHPSNLARLIDFYGGHMYDERDPETKQVTKPGVIDQEPDQEQMRNDLFSISVDNPTHYETMREVYDATDIIIEPHGAVGWRALVEYNRGKHDTLGVVYETADPGKFPEDVEKAIGITPDIPKRMQEQSKQEERIFSITQPSDNTDAGLKLTPEQIQEAKDKIKELLRN